MAPLVATGIITRKRYREIFAQLEQSAERVSTVLELVNAYRARLHELSLALSNATLSGQEAGTRRAVAVIQERFGERLTVAQLAKVAGFAPDSFTRLFKRDEGVTPEMYLQNLRLERSRVMLDETQVSVDTVSKLCGFSSRIYFHRLFKQRTGVTPAEYRERKPRKQKEA